MQSFLARLMGQCCFAGWRLSSSIVVVIYRRLAVTLTVCGHAGRRARGQSGGRHCTAGQYGYVPLGRHVFVLNCLLYRNLHMRKLAVPIPMSLVPFLSLEMVKLISSNLLHKPTVASTSTTQNK